MRLLLFHPGALSVSCLDCRQYIYDIETGKVDTYRAGPKREERPCIRPPQVPPDCKACPKGGPENEAACHLTRRNWQTFQVYQMARATGGAGLTDEMRSNPRLMRDLILIDGLYRQHERERLAGELACQVAQLFRT